MTEIIRKFGGEILGQVETKSNGDVLVRKFGGSIVSRYVKSDNTTRDDTGRIIATGNVASGFLLKGVI